MTRTVLAEVDDELLCFVNIQEKVVTAPPPLYRPVVVVPNKAATVVSSAYVMIWLVVQGEEHRVQATALRGTGAQAEYMTWGLSVTEAGIQFQKHFVNTLYLQYTNIPQHDGGERPGVLTAFRCRFLDQLTLPPFCFIDVFLNICFPNKSKLLFKFLFTQEA